MIKRLTEIFSAQPLFSFPDDCIFLTLLPDYWQSIPVSFICKFLNNILDKRNDSLISVHSKDTQLCMTPIKEEFS